MRRRGPTAADGAAPPRDIADPGFRGTRRVNGGDAAGSGSPDFHDPAPKGIGDILPFGGLLGNTDLFTAQETGEPPTFTNTAPRFVDAEGNDLETIILDRVSEEGLEDGNKDGPLPPDRVARCCRSCRDRASSPATRATLRAAAREIRSDPLLP